MLGPPQSPGKSITALQDVARTTSTGSATGRRKVGIIKPSNVLLHLQSRIVRSFIRVAWAYEVENWYVRSGGMRHLYL
jgi:hypothetical protein